MKLAGIFGARRPPLAPDSEMIRTLAGLLGETGLTEIEYAIGDHRIRVAREPAAEHPPATNGHAPAMPPAASSAAGETPTANGAMPAGTVTSPVVGIAYLAAEPGASPFARPGDAVEAGQTLLIIEAMKVMNQIRAPRAGRIARIFIEDAQPVEYGAPLMLIE
ncbi:MAG TPA: acetyl-CoA carboxylase biotin carboxyl carrier protein subunit [Stellaceae bacterium]|nr:acetyl-CoA carboxylase biotin carboxyl carrier protein subunit [Stellaceae bacterium]